MRALLAACAAPSGPTPKVMIPDVGCPTAAKPPAPLPRIRTIEEIARWAAETEQARRQTADALAVCAQRLRETEALARHAVSSRQAVSQ